MEQKNLLNYFLKSWKKIASQYGISWKSSFLQWELPSNINADFALTLALPISFKSKQNSKEVAQEIIKKFDYSSCELTISKQGYINFRFPTDYYQNFLWKTYQGKGKNICGENKNIKLNIE